MKKVIILIIIMGVVIFTQKVSFGHWASDISSGVGARALGMGGAFIAIADGIDACFWNPAGLGNLGNSEFTIIRTMNNRDITDYQESLAVGTKLGNYGGLGISYTRVKDIFVWIEKSPINVALYGFDDEWISLAVGGYGSGYLKNVALGANMRKRYSSLLKVGTSTIPFRWSSLRPIGDTAEFTEYDIGILYHLNRECSIALVIQNFNEATIDYGEEAPIYKFPFARKIIKAGICFKPYENTSLAIDIYDLSLDNVYDRKIDRGQSGIRIGMEHLYKDKVAVRIGLLGKLYHTIGVGVRGEVGKLFPNVKHKLDYALLEGQGRGTHFLSYTVNF